MLPICRRYSKNSDDAYDILHDSFIKVYNHLADFKFYGSLEGWIKKIVIRTALNFYRNFSSQNETAGIEKYYGNVDLNPDILSDLTHQEIITKISKLPNCYRLVFNLFIVEGYSHKEVAEMLNIEESTSRIYLVKAKNILKCLLFELKCIII
jgi:RNA polymerase sigma-70 factor (ECF subfamily)